jgi:Acyclic terpene utilisation family protein AtuA
MAGEALAIGGGAGFSGDRTDAAGPVVDTLIARGGPAALIFETLAERTLALAQIARRQHPDAGYEPQLDRFVGPVLRRCVEHRIPIIGNFGAANPRAAARRLHALARELGLRSLRVGVVAGDDLSDEPGRALLAEHLPGGRRDFVSANVYQGAKPIADALRAGAQIVVTGRVADPSLAVGPAMAHYGWAEDDWPELGRATMAGHLLECGAQVTGGYFADPGLKDVPDLAHVGFPIAEVAADGSFTIGKAANTGGLVDARTVKEQLLYEVHDPAAYLTPDVVADISAAEVRELGRDRVAVDGVRGHPRTATLKVNAWFDGGWLGEAEISYAGPNAEARARLAAEIVRGRVGGALDVRFDLIGVLSVFADDGGRLLATRPPGAARDVRLRAAAVHAERARVERLLEEVTTLYTCGPAGGGGVRTSLRSRLSTVSCLVPRERVPARFEILE